MKDSLTFKQYLALVLGQKQRQRPAKIWPQPSKTRATMNNRVWAHGIGPDQYGITWL
jgi:hypothetical protein